MNCPVCKTTQVVRLALERDLPAIACKQCGGQWISSDDYSAWLEKHGQAKSGHPFSEVEFEVNDVQEAKICPDCGRILLKYKVGHGLDFYLDHCSACGGVWFDKHEWDALKGRDLHDQIHRIFSTSWQKQVRAEQVKEKLEALYANRFGAEGYARAKSVRDWVQAHPQKVALIAYIGEEDPYKM